MGQFEQDWLELGSRVARPCTASTAGTSGSSSR